MVELENGSELIEVKQTPPAYDFKYRVLKTLLLVLAWISFGLNFEVIGSTLEDLKLYLNVDYQQVSFNLVVRNMGYLFFVSFAGYLLDKLPDYTNLFMCFSSFCFAIPGLLIPITKTYWMSVVNFLIQGVASSLYDLGGNYAILSLWKGISNSPINAMHAGYGIGAMLSVQISKPFIKFDPMSKYRTTINNNSTTMVTYESTVDLTAPYWICSCVAIITSLLFLVFQYIEMTKYSRPKSTSDEKNPTEFKLMYVEESTVATTKNRTNFFKRLMFGDKCPHEGKSLAYMLVQIGLITMVLFCLQGFLTIISKFMLTYLTTGPAKMTIDEFTNLQSTFWLIFIVSRVLATFIAYNLSECASLVFVVVLLFLNTLASFLFMVPYLAQFKLFFVVNLAMIGLVSSPTHPCMFMIARHVLDDFNSFVISVFSLGLGLSSVVFQQLIGDLLDLLPNREHFLGFDNFNSSYIIAHILFVPAFLSLALFLLIVLIYKKKSHLIGIKS